MKREILVVVPGMFLLSALPGFALGGNGSVPQGKANGCQEGTTSSCCSVTDNNVLDKEKKNDSLRQTAKYKGPCQNDRDLFLFRDGQNAAYG